MARPKRIITTDQAADAAEATATADSGAPAPAPLAAVKTVAFRELRIDQLFPSPANPASRLDPSSPAVRELAESLRTLGLQQPIVVRQIEAPDNVHMGGELAYEIVAGHRRYAAARFAELSTLECRIVDCDEKMAGAVRAVENLQREDLHWTDEASGVAALVANGWTLGVIGHQIGKSPRWVALRSRLAQLHPEWLALARGGTPKGARAWRLYKIAQWPVAMLELVGRHGSEVQAAMAGDLDLLDTDTPAQLAAYIDGHYLMALKAAPWDLDDALIVEGAGACSACPRRSSAQQTLFDAGKGGDRCTDAPCWARKKTAYLELREAQLRGDHPRLVTISNHPGRARTATKDAVHSGWVETVKAGTKGATAAMDGDTGKLVHVKPVAFAPKEVLAKFGAAAIAGDDGDDDRPAPKTSAAERLKQHLSRRWRHVGAAVVTSLGGDPEAGWNYSTKRKAMKGGATTLPARRVLVALAAALGVQPDVDLEIKGRPTAAALGITYGDAARWRDFAALGKLGDRDVDGWLWQRVRGQLVNCLADVSRFPPDPGVLALICVVSGLDFDKLKAAALDALPLPRTLAAVFDEHGEKRGKEQPAKAKGKAKAGKGKA